MPRNKEMYDRVSWYVKCPECTHGGIRMGIGKQGNYVLVCPVCKQCFPIGALVKHYAPDLAEALWGPGKGTISGRVRGKGASDGDDASDGSSSSEGAI